MKQRIAFFDFDGTITTKDTLLEFIKFYKSPFWFYTGFILYSPLILAYKAGIIPNYVAKQKVMAFFFKGENVDVFQNKCDVFAETFLPRLLRPKALHEISRLKSANAQVVIVSASAENWIKKWAVKNDLTLIGTRLTASNHTITGTFDGKNCYGDEKVCRIKQLYNLNDYGDIYCYGDSSGDKPMLALATVPFYKPFR